jgi:hypothetical protein
MRGSASAAHYAKGLASWHPFGGASQPFGSGRRTLSQSRRGVAFRTVPVVGDAAPTVGNHHVLTKRR